MPDADKSCVMMKAVDIERTMEFILQQQAKFFAGMEEMRLRDEEARRRQDTFDQRLNSFVEKQEKVNMALGKAMLGLTDHIERLTAAQAATDERLNRLTAAQSATDDRLNALIGVVDDIVRRPPAA